MESVNGPGQPGDTPRSLVEAPGVGESFALAHSRPPRRWARIVLVTALALLLTAGGFFVLTRPRGPDVALALGFRDGATYRYRMTMSMDGTLEVPLAEVPLDGEFSQTIAYHVVSVEPDGAATIDVEVEDVEGAFAGQSVPEPTMGVAVRMVIGPDGRLLELDGRPLPEALQQAWSDPTGSGGLPGMQQFPLLPNDPVGPGDEWVKDIDQPVPFGVGAWTVHSENEFVRYEDLGGVQAAVIESDITSPIDWAIDLREVAEVADEFGSRKVSAEDFEGMPTRISYRGDLEQEQRVWLDPDRRELLRTEATAEFDITTRAEGGEGFGALLGALAARFVGEMELTMERL